MALITRTNDARTSGSIAWPIVAAVSTHRSWSVRRVRFGHSINGVNEMKHIETTVTPRLRAQIALLAIQIDEGQARLDAYIKQQNKPHLVARRWLRMQLIRLFN